jgi:hypothetical protein
MNNRHVMATIIIGIVAFSTISHVLAAGPVASQAASRAAPAARRTAQAARNTHISPLRPATSGSSANLLNAQQALARMQLRSSAIAPQLAFSTATGMAAMAARIAARNPGFTPQQAMAQAVQESAAIASRLPSLSRAESAAIAARLAGNPQFASELAENVGPLSGPLTNAENIPRASRLALASAQGRSALATEIAAENPQLSPQQAAHVADNEIAGIASQLTAENRARFQARASQNAGQFPFDQVLPSGVSGFPDVVLPQQGGVLSPGIDSGASVATDGVAQTAPGAALQGLAQVTGAVAQQDLALSLAAVNASQAENNALRNNVQNVQTFWEMQNIGRAQRANERGPRATSNEIAQRAHERAQPRLSASQIDPLTGALYWPGPLQDARYDARRSAIDRYAAKWARYGTLDATERKLMRENINGMLDSLKSQMSDIPPREYLNSRSFLKSLLITTTGELT